MGGGRVGGGRWEGYGNGQVRCDRRSDSMPVFEVGWLGMSYIATESLNMMPTLGHLHPIG